MLRFWRGDKRGEREARKAGSVLGGVALGERPWLVLGGGGLKGLTHLGVLKVLRETGFEPAGIVGTSIGALVGAAVASGADLDALVARARRLRRGDIARVDRRAVWVNGVRSESFFLETPLRDYIAGALPGNWEEFDIRFQANAVELGSGRTEWFGIGARTDVKPVEAVYASAALPVFYPPARLPGGVYMDGGAEYALPLHRAAELGATGIVAVDPGAHETASAEAVAAGGMLAVHERVFSIMSGRLRRHTMDEWDGPPLLYLRPELEGYRSFNFAHVPYFLEEGERTARVALGLTVPLEEAGADPAEDPGAEPGAARGIQR